MWVLVLACLRVALEAAKAVCIAVSMRRQDMLVSPAWLPAWYASSPALLLWRTCDRTAWWRACLFRAPSPTEHVAAFFHTGLAQQLPLLAVTYWYFVHVIQTGFRPLDWVSLLGGLVLIPVTLARAAFAALALRNGHAALTLQLLEESLLDKAIDVSAGASAGAGAEAELSQPSYTLLEDLDSRPCAAPHRSAGLLT